VVVKAVIQKWKQNPPLAFGAREGVVVTVVVVTVVVVTVTVVVVMVTMVVAVVVCLMSWWLSGITGINRIDGG
jgi:hypothetical protein